MNNVIAIATYMRPLGLALLLESIRMDSSACQLDIVIVDNDPDGSAFETTLRFDTLRIVYLREPLPGIAAARNCALEYALMHSYDGLVFVDDDEWVSDGWFGHLLATWSEWDADVVCGPVIPDLPKHASKWIKSGRFFERQNFQTGGEVRWPATNNVFIALNGPGIGDGVRFSENFALTGGEDSDFFYRLKQYGSRIVWARQAIVSETVPMTRANLAWIWRRGNRLGNVSARLLRRRYPKWFVGLIAIVRIVLSLPLVLVARMSGNSWGAAAMHLPKGIGMLQALAGNLTQEYKR